eukprot:SAG31_NODE_5004_length_2807_cov_1.624446_6_plen_62_part_00
MLCFKNSTDYPGYRAVDRPPWFLKIITRYILNIVSYNTVLYGVGKNPNPISRPYEHINMPY